ncbi:MAG: MFS transporter [Chloroflexota bacterium]|nr:MAG: MFS transporter [Chloroflexota bacterium]UCF26602.1 MAG: MFS transporter [Chloroflexota bacterium]
MSTSIEPAATSNRWPRAIRSFQNKNFRSYWSGQVISQIGTWMQIVAQSWVVYDLTDSPLMLGLVNFAALLPVLPISLLAGVLSDRFPRRNIIIMSESILMLQAIIMAGLIWFNIIQVWHVILLSFVLGAAAALEQPARLAFVVDIVGKKDLSNAVALNSSGFNSARIIGPALAGLMIAAIGEAACFIINGLTYLAFILVLFAIQVPHQIRKKDSIQVMGSLKDGFKYILDSKIILGLLLIVSVASFLTIPYIALMPVFARDVLQTGPDGLGFLLTAVGVGAIFGAMISAYLKDGKRGKWILAANITGPIFLILFCFSKYFIISLLIIVLVGASNAIRLTLANSLTQLNTSDEYHGRVMSVFNLLFNGMSRFGALAVGGLAEIITATWALTISAGISAIIGFVLFIQLPHIRKLP